MKTFTFSDGTTVPAIGLGTWQLEGETAHDAVAMALDIGYRHIDTADMYGNHRQVGTAITASGLNRDDIFLTTKLWREDLSEDAIHANVHRFLDELQTAYLNLVLIHWPNGDFPIAGSLGALTRLQKEGVIRSLGVSNFGPASLKEAIDTDIPVVTDQVELHPSFAQPDLQAFCREHNVILTAYSPVGRGQDLTLPQVTQVAAKYGCTPSQAILNWLVGKGIIAIPKASSREHLMENFHALDWTMADEDIALMDTANGETRLIHPPFADFR